MTNQQEIKNSSLEWISHINASTAQAGSFSTQDSLGNPIDIEWEMVDPMSARLNEKIKEIAPLLIPAYAQVELDFAKKCPQAVEQDYMLKPLADFFANGTEKIEWQVIEQKITGILEQFLNQTNFTQFANPDEIHFFVMATDKKTNKQLGVMHFLIAPDFTFGTVRVGMHSDVSADQNRGIKKLLMGSIFIIIPKVTRIFLHTRKTNEPAIAMYQSWGFTQFPGPLEQWIDLEYLIDSASSLQKTVSVKE